jgi:hypothetical protein
VCSWSPPGHEMSNLVAGVGHFAGDEA